jgi:hypothetical protein
MPRILRVSRTRSHECSERLEPDIRERISPVLRGGGNGNVVSSLDTMKLTVMGQMNKGMQKMEARELMNDVEKQLDSLKHHLWNGNITQALRLIDYLQLILRDDTMSLERKKLLKAVREFGGYIATNQQFIPDYGDRYRNDETITTSFVESAVNQVVSKRFVKSQQMRWSQRGAHLLLQVRTQVLNKELRSRFQQWYPGMADESEPEIQLAA